LVGGTKLALDQVRQQRVAMLSAGYKAAFGARRRLKD